MPSTAALTAPLTEKLTGDLFGSTFSILGLNPILYFDAASSMLDVDGNQAGFLERVATFDNLTGGPDATQSTDASRPRALPLIDNKGYLYLSGVAGNYAEFDEQILPSLAEFELEVKFYRSRSGVDETLVSQYIPAATGRLNFSINTSNQLRVFVGAGTNIAIAGGTVSEGVNTVKLKRIATSPDNYAFQLFINGTKVAESVSSDTVSLTAVNTHIGELEHGTGRELRGAIMSVKVDDDVICDFTDTSVDHGSTSFACETSQTVTINNSGLDPSLLLRRPVLRFDGVQSSDGNMMFANLTSNIDTVHSFIKLAVNADSGYSGSTPIALSVIRIGLQDYNTYGARLLTGYTDNSARSFYNSGHKLIQNGKFSRSQGAMVVETSLSIGAQFRKTNNTDKISDTASLPLDSNRVFIGRGSYSLNGHAPIDVEQIVLFDRVVPEADTQQVYNKIKVVPSYDSDASAYMSLLESDGVNLSEAKKDAINTFYQKGKNAGWYSSLKRFYLPVWGSAAPNARCLVSNTSGTFIGSITHGSGFAHPTTASSSNRFNLNYSLLDDLTTEDFCLMALAYDDTEPRDRAIPINHTIIGSGPTSGTSIRVSASSSSAKPIAICLGVNADEGLIGTHGVLLTNRLGGDTSLTTLDATTPTDTSTTGSLTGSYGNFPISGFGSTVNASGVTTGATDAKAGAFGISEGLTESQRSSYALAIRHLWEECSGLTL